MTRSAEYKCIHCNQVEWAETPTGHDIPETITHYCFVLSSHWPMLRRYSAPHTGQGSSGEKPK